MRLDYYNSFDVGVWESSHAPVSMLGGTMKKSLKRALALLLACTIVIGSVYNTRQKTYASASAIIAGGGAATVGVEVAFPYLLAITGVVAAGAAGYKIYQNRDSIKEWGATQLNRFKNWVNEKKDEFGWWTDSAVAGTAIAAWGDKLGKGTLDKSDPTWTAYKDWLKDDVYSVTDVSEYNGYPWGGKNCSITVGGHLWGASSENGDTGIYTYLGTASGYLQMVVVSESDTFTVYRKGSVFTVVTGTNHSVTYKGKTYYYTVCGSYGYDADRANYLGILGTKEINAAETAVRAFVDGVADSSENKNYAYVGGLSGVLGGAGVLEGDWDVVGVGEAEDEKETKLPWVQDPSIDDLLGGVAVGENTWTDVLNKVGVGVVEKTGEGDMVIDNDGVTTKEWEYADSTTDVPDISIPDTAEVSKELSSYTFLGLEKFFPFCLPFDMIDFINVLDAPAQAPHFVWSFPYPTMSGMKTYGIDIDLSPFDSVAELLRDMECLLFIVGLAVVTRSRMIRG